MLIILALAMGALVGSFINVAVDRLPKELSIVRPRPYCGSCNHSLANFYMVPVFGYIWFRGRCRYCEATIPLRVFLTEIATGVLFVILYLIYGFGPGFFVASVMVSLMLIVALIDLEHGLILNRVTYPAILVLLLLAPFWPELGISREFLGTAGSLGSLFNSLVAGFGAFLIFLIIVLVHSQGMGGGDPKLAGVVGLLVGFPGVLVALSIAVVSAGILSIFLLAFRKKDRKDAIPFGPFLAAGAIVTFVAGNEMIARFSGISADLMGS